MKIATFACAVGMMFPLPPGSVASEKAARPSEPAYREPVSSGFFAFSCRDKEISPEMVDEVLETLHDPPFSSESGRTPDEGDISAVQCACECVCTCEACGDCQACTSCGAPTCACNCGACPSCSSCACSCGSCGACSDCGACSCACACACACACCGGKFLRDDIKLS